MATKIFPTNFSDISSSFNLQSGVPVFYVDDGQQNGYVPLTKVISLLPSFGASGSTHAQGQVPDPGAVGGASRFLCENGSWVAPSSGVTQTTYGPFGPSGTNHSAGLVPDPGSIPGVLKYLREDATWVQPPAGTTYGPFGPSGQNHSAGLVPDPGTSGTTVKYLREDATWDVPPGTLPANAALLGTDNTGAPVVITAGTGIAITNGAISASGSSGGSGVGPVIGKGPYIRPTLAAMTQINKYGNASNNLLVDDAARGGPISQKVSGSGYAVNGQAVVPPTSGSFTYTMLIEGISRSDTSGYGVYLEDAIGKGLWCYFVNGVLKADFVTTRDTRTSTFFQRQSIMPSSTWFQINFFDTNGVVSIDISSNGFAYEEVFNTGVAANFGRPVLVGFSPVALSGLSGFESLAHLWHMVQT